MELPPKRPLQRGAAGQPVPRACCGLRWGVALRVPGGRLTGWCCHLICWPAYSGGLTERAMVVLEQTGAAECKEEAAMPDGANVVAAEITCVTRPTRAAL